ncbi:MAG: hypothetical protein ABIR24_04865 [Verrucomicrobiota bacterium]
MRILTTLIVFSLAVLSGCATHDQMRFKAGSGDAGQFIVRQAVARGAQPISTTELPVIRSAWRFGEDQFGVVVRLPREDGTAVERLLQQAFGEPKYGPKDTPSGGRWGAYRLSPGGVSIQFTSDDQGTEVVVLRQLTKQEHADGVSRAMQELEKSETR